MVILPCSMKTLGQIATCTGESLIPRAADVVLKERRRLVLGVRESPFHEIHLQHMLTLTRMGAIVAPPVPAFYTAPTSLDQVIDHTVTRMLDLFDIATPGAPRWDGDMHPGGRAVLPDTTEV
jgi:4-hydroxy-3-polyprenylbenzoate decarboxylase